MEPTIVIPFFNGHRTITRLLNSLPADLPVVIVDDLSDRPIDEEDLPPREDLEIIRPSEKGYFTGAVNNGIDHCQTDVLVLNQDVWFEGDAFFNLLSEKRDDYALIGEGIAGKHPAWPEGYVHGTCMFMRRDAIEAVGKMDAELYPLWGSTCEWQLRVCRAGFKALPLRPVPGLRHERADDEHYGSAIRTILKREPGRQGEFIRTPPEISVVIPAHNYGRYLTDAVNSLIGGPTSLGEMGQTFQSFEVIIVDDASTDETVEIGAQLADPWKGVRYMRLPNSHHPDGHPGNGTPVANNRGIQQAHGRYIAILCADDMMEPWRLEEMHRLALEHPHHFVFDDLQVLTHGERVRVWPMPDYHFDTLVHKNQVHAGILFPKEAWQEVGGYPEVMRYGREDWAFNVQLGIHGWCGVHLPRPGYLYRREQQNRTLRNTTPQWRRRFLDQMRGLFPRIYAGERPMSCCGDDGVPASQRQVMTPSAVMPGESGMLEIQYIGHNQGTQSWYGPVTGKRYVFGGSRPVGFIDERDWPAMRTEYWDYDHDQPRFQLRETDEAGEAQVSTADAQDANDYDAGARAADEAAPDPEPEPADKIDVPDPSNLTVSDIRGIVPSLTASELLLLREKEADGDARVTALKAIDAALEERSE